MTFPLEDFKKHSTPFYAYDMGLLRRTLEEISDCIRAHRNFHVHYALKANNNGDLLRCISSYGLGADCVSGNEVKRAIETGFMAHSIVYAGVGKRAEEIALALDAGIGCFNVESMPELDTIDSIAGSKGLRAPVAIRINPDIDAHTHRSITTGTYEDQFGIPLVLSYKVVEHAVALENIDLVGLHFHIGSQITEMEPFKLLCDRVNGIVDYWRERGVHFKWINVGGGLGIDYEDPDLHPVADFKRYFDEFEAVRLEEGQQLHFELGRSVVAQCGSLITRVLYIKESVDRQFAIVDAGFNDLIRPALYGATHRIDDLTPHGNVKELYDVVGPICESTDCFGRNVELPQLFHDDLLAIRSAGAYGESMSSTYNMRELPGKVLFNR